MTWADLHARTELVHTVLDRAARNPADPNLFHDLPELDRLFGGVDGLLLALRHRWENHLTVKLDHALAQGKSVDQVRLELAAEQPALRAVLDRYGTDELYRRPRPRALAS
ncbi:hypothetical protein LTV02_00685 [Nocardia yamanashiensis]|uniref:hypothetical protein n=1 Tax=Nocardia yamanashiensis TaxID=209247 RepID=UPI00082ABB48|nr:hypothetical protein [Nocardia yamanashiensis]UGT41982.1 hypothetical protein LTV02_00685 [Nocardia yamanashiensis]